MCFVLFVVHSGIWLGYLLNWNVKLMKSGRRRQVGDARF